MTAFDGSGLQLGWVLFAIVAAMAVVMVLVIKRLREGHPQTWSQMGKPGVLKFWGDYKGRWSIFKFVFTDGHRALNDSGLSSLVWMMRGLIAAGLVVFGVMVANGQLHW